MGSTTSSRLVARSNSTTLPPKDSTVPPPTSLVASSTTGVKMSINVYTGDLITQQTDVIVVCSSSEFLFNTICTAGGSSVKTSYDAETKGNPQASLIAVKADGQLVSKMIYFLPWKPNSDTIVLQKSIEKFVSDAVEKAIADKYQSIAFPAIGCGKFGCSTDLVAQAMVEEAYRMSQKSAISISFVIPLGKDNIREKFRKRIHLLETPQSSSSQPKSPIDSPSILPTPSPLPSHPCSDSQEQSSLSSADPVKTIAVIIKQGAIEVEKGDITTQKVDVIIGSSSSEILKKTLIKAAGDTVQTVYETEYKNDSNAVLISTPPGSLSCKRIFFVKWEPFKEEGKLRQSIVDLVWMVIQNVMAHKYTSIAFPAIGCGQHGCSIDVVVKTMVKEMKNQLTLRDIPLKVKFIIEPTQTRIYDEFCKQVLTTQDGDHEGNNCPLPKTWARSNDKGMRFELSSTTDEYKSISTTFDETINGKCTQIMKIERIQNERWYIQYWAHNRNFKTRLAEDTEKYLYHGCSDQAASSIIEECFNRSFAGIHGTAYGVGVYFSSRAAYSHGYATANANGERNMFLARVLVGNTTPGKGSMRTRPVGFDSTTDGDHIFVTYHDAQAYADYLITYK